MTPAQYDFSVVRGSAGPTQGLVFRLKAQSGDTLVNIPYDDVVLSIYKGSPEKPGANILRASLTNTKLIESNPSEAEITWVPDAEDTRLVPLGEKSAYEIEVWNGTSEIVYMYGVVTGLLGGNSDEDEVS